MSDLRINPALLPIEGKQQTKLERPSGPTSELDKEKLRLRKATREFESFFMQSMLKSMRATIPKTDESGDAPGGGFGKDIFESMFDQELAKKMSERSQGGLGDMLYQKLLPRLEAVLSPEQKSAALVQTETDLAQSGADDKDRE